MPSKAAIQPVEDVAVDDLTHVPRAVKERYWNLVARREAAFDQLSGSSSRLVEYRNDALRAEREVRDLEDAADRGTLMRHATADEAPAISMRDDARLKAARHRAETAQERHARAKAQHAALTEELRVLGGLAQRCERYLTETQPTKLKAATATSPDLKRGESVTEALDRVREEIGKLKRQTRTLSSGPGSISDAKAAMRIEVAKLATEGEPNVGSLFNATRPHIGWPMWTVPGLNINGYTVRTVNAAALLAALYQDDLIAFLDKRIDAYGAGVETEMLSATERAARLTSIAKASLDFGYQEQAILDRAEKEGASILPRADADVRAVLMLSPDSPAPDRINV